MTSAQQGGVHDGLVATVSGVPALAYEAGSDGALAVCVRMDMRGRCQSETI